MASNPTNHPASHPSSSVPETGSPAASSSAMPFASLPGHEGRDTFLESLVFLTAYHGRAKSADAIRAGLAYDEQGMGPALFCEAARRLNLKVQVKKRLAFQDIPGPVLPAVIVLKDKTACVLLKNDSRSDTVRVFWPATQVQEDIKRDVLRARYSGYAIFVHPQVAFVDPDAPETQDADRHWFWSAVLDNKWIYGRVVLAAILVNLFALTAPIYIMNIYNRVIPNNALETGWVLTIGALTIYIFDFIIRTVRAYFLDLAGRRIDVIVTRRIYDQLLDMKLAGKPPSSGAFANMLREFESVREFLTSATLTGLVDLPFTILFLTVIYIIGGPIAFLLACLIVTVIGFGMMLQWPLKAAVRKSMHASEAKHGLLVETINGLETIKSISGDGRMRARYGTHVGESAAHGQASRFISGLGVNIATFFQQSATLLVVLIGMYLIRDSEMTMGALIACVLLGGRAIAPIGQVANLLVRYHQARSSLRTLNRIMAQPVERPAHKQFLHRPSLKGKIAFDKVSFTYPHTARKVLDSVSFTIEPGEKVGLVGRIGSGKSTISRLILGLYDPQDGALYADDTDYRQIDPADLRRNMAYIAQDIVLFRGTVRENIAISRPQATEDEILQAAQSAGVHDFIARHPMGYDAPVGERGEGLSGGQRQSIALARAMLLRPQIMVCDEPTNAMDVEAENNFVRHIREQIADRTFILITHRQHLLALVDRLIVMDQGRVVIDGPRDKVIEALAAGKVAVPKGA